MFVLCSSAAEDSSTTNLSIDQEQVEEEEEEQHVILGTSIQQRTKSSYINRIRSFNNDDIGDRLEVALGLKAGEFTGEQLEAIMFEIFGNENVVSYFVEQAAGGIMHATAEPSEIFLAHCRRIIERKFNEPNFGALSAMDVNESEDQPDVLFGTQNLAVPVFYNTDVDGAPSNEVHLFVLEIARFHNKHNMQEEDEVTNVVKYLLDQKYTNDNTWVGIYEYADLDDHFLLPPGGGQSGSSDEQDSDTREDHDRMSRSTIILENQSSWCSMHYLFNEIIDEFPNSLAYRFFEAIGIKDPETGVVTISHPNPIRLGVPTLKN